MNICNVCGNTFTDDDRARWTESHGETFSGCPLCGGDYGEAVRCKCCGEYVYHWKTFDGFCEDCLRDAADYDVILEYLEADSLLVDFFFSQIWDMNTPGDMSAELLLDLHDLFLRRKANERLLDPYRPASERQQFLTRCQRYIFDSTPDDILSFAEWYAERGCKK